MKNKQTKIWKRFLFVFTIATLMFILGACGGDSNATGGKEEGKANASSTDDGETIKIGVMLSFTGPYAPLAESVKNGFDLYLEENDNKLGGRNVEVIYEDDEGDQKQALSKYRQLVTGNKVDLLVGTISSSITYSLIDRINKDEIVLIKPIPSGNEKTWENKSEYIFPNLVSNYQNGAAAAEYISENIGKKAVTIGADYVAGHEVIEAFKYNFEAAGGQVIEEIYTDLGTNDFATYLTKIAKLEPDLVYAFVPGSDGIRLINQYDEFGLKEKIAFTGALEFGDTLLTEPTGKASEGILSAGVYSPWLDNDVNKKFLENYQLKYDNKLPNIFSVGGYDAAQMIDQAVSKTGSIDSKDLVKALSGISFDSPRGPISIDPKTRVPVSDFFISKNVWKDGQIVPEIIGTVENVVMPESNPAK